MGPHLNQGKRDAKPWLDCNITFSVHLNVFAHRIEIPTAQNNPQFPSCSKPCKTKLRIIPSWSCVCQFVPAEYQEDFLNHGKSQGLIGHMVFLHHFLEQFELNISGSQLIRTLIRDCSFSTHRRTTNYSPALMEQLSPSAQLLNSLMHWCIQFHLLHT